MKTTTRVSNYKSFDLEFKIVDSIETLEKVEIELYKENHLNIKGLVTKTDDQISIEASNSTFADFDNSINDVSAIIKNMKVVIDRLSIDSTENKINNDGISSIATLSLNVIKSKNIDDELNNYRCFIPVGIDKLSDFYWQFETITYQDDQTDHFYDCIRVTIDNFIFDIVRLKRNGKEYLIIENIDKACFSFFCDVCFSIKQALGFITSYMPGGEEYFFTSDLDFYYCNHHRSKIDSMYKPLHKNPYHILINKKEIAEAFVDKLNVLPANSFSNLISAIHRSSQFSSAIILLLEASSIRSLLLIPSVFSVIIEALSKIISQDESGKELPINDPQLFQQIKADMYNLIDLNSDKIAEAGVLKIKRRLNEINKPVVKEHLTNNEKLTLPFEQLGIKLTINDINAIEHRNDLLHGNILLSDENRQSEEEMNKYMGYISAKLYTLISTLILRYVGYNGYVINHAKFYEELCKIKTDEEYYVNI